MIAYPAPVVYVSIGQHSIVLQYATVTKWLYLPSAPPLNRRPISAMLVIKYLRRKLN